jgi:chromate transporter
MTAAERHKTGSPLEVLLIFLRLGVTSFGGPIVPSAIALIAFAFGADALRNPASLGLLHGLKLVAVAVVAPAVWGMARTLCPDRERASIATIAAVIMLLFGCSDRRYRLGLVCRTVALPWCPAARDGPCCGAGVPDCRSCGARGVLCASGRPSRPARLCDVAGIAPFEAFYRSRALVFGGGHVVLPLLSEAFATSGWVGNDAFLAGYGAAQAVPGPLFTFAAYLGAVVRAALDLIGIFLPGINPYGHAAVLGHVPQTCRRAGSDAGGQCGSGRTAGRRTLQPGLDQLSQGAGRPRHRPLRLCAIDHLARAATGRRHI